MTDTSTLFELLASRQRRRLLFLLCDAESVEVPDGLQSRSAAAMTNGDSSKSPNHTVPSDLAVELHHTHLPKLAAADLIEWDQSAEAVRRGPEFGEVEPALDTLRQNAPAFPSDVF
ncbi:DUF7344 domain-containing protein [Salinirubrum litoreum]|uniref:DUF7344 domain-containing protein n=1 Tax=Salinirubrum litoreum TaxID=1126234 RepID=A0ABD5RF20_9EURY|nr:hypothetical protein [Salinirubrum litoreum]